MFKQSTAVLVVAIATVVAGCGASNTAYIDANAVLERTAKTLVNFDAYLRRYDYKSVDNAMLDQFNRTIQHDLNKQPAIHSTSIVTQTQKDASILGYGDLNNDGRVSEKEPKLFKIEFDADNNRIIITTASSGKSAGRRMSSGGFFAGVMISNVVDRQSKAGIKPGHFNGRRVAGAPAGRKVASSRKAPARRRAPNARGRARSGGIRAGK